MRTTITTRTLLPLTLASLLGTAALAQPAPPMPPQGRMPTPIQPGAPMPPSRPFGAPTTPPVLSEKVDKGLSRFDLDFPGGTPKELVAAIQKAMNRPLNAIVPDEFANTKLPALKMNNVDLPQLFQALEAASRKTEGVVTGNYMGAGVYGGYTSYQQVNTSYGFKTEGKATDESIWYFYVTKPVLPPASSMISSAKVCRFYALAPYLDKDGGAAAGPGAAKHLTVDDITTAIETGWKMMGDTNPPAISFHKDTRLLIAVGEPSKLETIDAVLKALDATKAPQLGGRIRSSRLMPTPPVNPTENAKTNE